LSRETSDVASCAAPDAVRRRPAVRHSGGQCPGCIASLRLRAAAVLFRHSCGGRGHRSMLAATYGAGFSGVWPGAASAGVTSTRRYGTDRHRRASRGESSSLWSIGSPTRRSAVTNPIRSRPWRPAKILASLRCGASAILRGRSAWCRPSRSLPTRTHGPTVPRLQLCLTGDASDPPEPGSATWRYATRHAYTCRATVTTPSASSAFNNPLPTRREAWN
jgi:hypothetical protein